MHLFNFIQKKKGTSMQVQYVLLFGLLEREKTKGNCNWMQVHKVLTEASMEASRDPVINNFCPEPKDPAVQLRYRYCPRPAVQPHILSYRAWSMSIPKQQLYK